MDVDFTSWNEVLRWMREHADEPFKPCVVASKDLVQTMYLTEDVSYVRAQVDEYLDLLWHPVDPRAVGVIWLVYDPVATQESLTERITARFALFAADNPHRSDYATALALLLPRVD